MNLDNKFASIFLAIQTLFNDNDIAQIEDANRFITQWQLSSNSVEDCVEILFTIDESHILFIMIKTIQIHIRFFWDKTINKKDFILDSLLNLLTKSYILQIHRDFIFICISDIANQTGNLDETIINSIPEEFILRFFSFFFENWNESFIHYLIQPNFISVGIELLQGNETGNEWFRILKVLSSKIHEIDCFIQFFQQLIESDITSNENKQFFTEIISNFCFLEFQNFEEFKLFLDFFIICSQKLLSPFLWISFFEIRTNFFNEEEKIFLNLIELAMNEFFERCLNEDLESTESNLLWIDLISVSFSFFNEYNSNQMIQYQFNFLHLISYLLENLIINDEEINSILSNLHQLNAFNEFVQSQQENLSFNTIIAYNSNFLPFEFVHQIASKIFIENNKNEEYNESDYMILSFIEKTYSLLNDDFSDCFLMKINELFNTYAFRSSKVLYFIVSKNYMLIDESYFELFHQYIQYESPYIIPSLLFLLKEENNDFLIEINSIISEMIDSSDIYDFLIFIYSMIKKFPKNGFPYLLQFFNEFSINLIDLLIQISFESDDEIINKKIVDIFSIILMKEYLTDCSCFIEWIDNLMTIEDRISEFHIYFLSNFDVFSCQNSQSFFEQTLISLHELSYENLNGSELFKSIIELMRKTSFDNSIEMWSIFPIQFLFDALSFKDSIVLNKAQIIISNNIQENSASYFIGLLISHLFSDENKLSIILLLSSISRKMNADDYIQCIINYFPFNSDILNQFISFLVSSINIPQLLLITNQLIQFYS